MNWARAAFMGQFGEMGCSCRTWFFLALADAPGCGQMVSGGSGGGRDGSGRCLKAARAGALRGSFRPVRQNISNTVKAGPPESCTRVLARNACPRIPGQAESRRVGTLQGVRGARAASIPARYGAGGSRLRSRYPSSRTGGAPRQAWLQIQCRESRPVAVSCKSDRGRSPGRHACKIRGRESRPVGASCKPG